MSIRPQSTPLAWILVGAATLFAGVANAQEGELTAGVPPNFPIAEFQTRDQTARWLLRYDWAAWKSSDEVYKLPAEELRKVLGPEWYCSDSERTWDCYYGKYDPAAGRYLHAFHLQSKNGAEFVHVSTPPPSDEATAYGRALHLSRTSVPPEFKNAGFRFNVYIRRTAGGEIEVWYLPGGQPNGTLVYGGQVCVTLDASGRKILSTAVSHNQFRCGKADPTINLTLNNEHEDIATVGNIFFVLQFGKSFKSVSIVGRRFVSGLIQVTEGGEEAWAHFERPVDEGKKYPSSGVERTRLGQRIRQKPLLFAASGR